MEENQIIEKTQVLLDDFTTYIDNSVWREKYGMGLKNLQQELNAPCVLAFAGKVIYSPFCVHTAFVHIFGFLLFRYKKLLGRSLSKIILRRNILNSIVAIFCLL